MTDVEKLLALFAAIASAVIVATLFTEVIRRKRQTILEMVVWRATSFEWKFLEEITEDVFSDSSQKVISILVETLGDKFDDHDARVHLVEAKLHTLLEKNVVTDQHVIYSGSTKNAEPHLFRNLPLWRVVRCEAYLVTLAEQDPEIVDTGELLTRYRKLPTGKLRRNDPPDVKPAFHFGGFASARSGFS